MERPGVRSISPVPGANEAKTGSSRFPTADAPPILTQYPRYHPTAPPPFNALRTPDWLFVVYRDGERQLYDLNADPSETTNIASTADTRLVAALYSQMQAVRSCTGDTCRTADAIALPGPTS